MKVKQPKPAMWPMTLKIAMMLTALALVTPKAAQRRQAARASAAVVVALASAVPAATKQSIKVYAIPHNATQDDKLQKGGEGWRNLLPLFYARSQNSRYSK
jgi:hypothetical protein